MFVALVGPDGAGKTTVATAIEHAARAQGKRFAYVHYLPGRSAPAATVPAAGGPPPEKNQRPKHLGPRQWLGSFARLGWNWSRFWFGFLLGMRRHVPGLRGSNVVLVADRWIYNFVAQPESVAYYGPSWLARLAIRFAPRPDLTVVLDAPAHVVVGRKGELTLSEAEAELRRWRSLRLPNPVVLVDATALTGRHR